MRKEVIIKIVLVVALMFSLITLPGCMKPSLTTESQPTSGGTISPNGGTYDNGVVVDISATPSAGYRFDHWEGSASGKSSTVQVTMDGSKKVIANFVKTFTLNVSSSPTTGGSINPYKGTFDEGQNVTIVASPAANYQFNGWGGDISGNTSTITVLMNSNKNIVASFIKATYSLQTNIGTPGGGTVQPSNGSFEAGSTITVTAIPSSGYRFNHWEGSSSSTNPAVNLLVDTNKQLTAFFTRVYGLNVAVTPSGSGSVTNGQGSFDSGSTVSITAAPVFPYVFDHWTGTNNDSVNPTTVTMNGAQSATAYFTKLNAGTQQTKTGTIYNNGNAMPTFSLKAGQWVEVGIALTGVNPNAPLQILDPSFGLIKDLGTTSTVTYTFQASKTGDYTVKIGANYTYSIGYTVRYTIYS